VFAPREMRRELSASRVTLALMLVAGGGAERAVGCVTRDEARRGVVRVLVLDGAGLGGGGGATRGAVVAMVGGGAAISGTVVQAARESAARAAMRGVLHAMSVSLSCARCFDHW
jgi:hypothetical protein